MTYWYLFLKREVNHVLRPVKITKQEDDGQKDIKSSFLKTMKMKRAETRTNTPMIRQTSCFKLKLDLVSSRFMDD